MKLRKRMTGTESSSDDVKLEGTAENDSTEIPDVAKPEKSTRRRPASITFYAKAVGFGILAAAVGGLSAYVLSQFQGNGTAELQRALTQQSQDIGALRDRVAGIETELATVGGRLTEAGELQTDVDRIQESDAAQTAAAEQHGRALALGAEEIADLKLTVAGISRELSALEESSRQRLAELEARPPAVISVDAPEGQEQELVFRLAEIESGLSALRSRITVLETNHARLAAAEEVAARLTSLEARIESLPGSEDLGATVDDHGRRIANLESGLGETSPIPGSGLGIVAVRAAVEIGTPYYRIVSDAGFSDDDLPSVVYEHAATGVVTASYLKDSFDGFAREALRASSRPDSATGDGGGVGGFLRSLFQVRPLFPRDGETAGAILSRAEAALDENNIEGSLQILGSLPEASRDAMSNWIQAAEARVAVLSALDNLAGSTAGE